ncbi:MULTISPECIES: hypothetical protein [Paraburkholderia]|uniref:Uncharacterized protein n=1 Tax=Paraburkholderia podalyriae TaxID=1938811 RepID=A0ABR7PG71_9BURK|nr:hypothetical protein [Paraburkholderia podalyriae]MBC8745351.1 hypothetical protein [Paraburkholderia podalyriae]
MPENIAPNTLAEMERKLFDLADADGVNDSERILNSLCRRSFLRLWSQTNVYTDEGFKDGKGSTRELCDALVIFGNDVIVFSDKHIAFQADKKLAIAWPRWYRRAILESCKQLHGAMSWLQRFPSRVYLDAKSTRSLPVVVPAKGAVNFHLVAVTRGSRQAALAYNDGEGLGSFRLNSEVESSQHLDTPFLVGLPEPEKHFVHVFDEVSIELLLSELDTAADFLDYLKKRAALLGRRGTHVSAYREEELLAAYLRTMDSDGQEHVFFEPQPDGAIPDAILFDVGIYEALKNDPGYTRKKNADKVGYEWDKLIERFVEYGDPGIHNKYGTQGTAETEQGLRLMAAETRFRRRQLAETFIGALQRITPGDHLGRLAYAGVAGETVYVFVVVAKRQDESYASYREFRFARLHAYVRTAKLLAPLGTVFVGVAFDNPHKDYQGGSEDLLVWTQENWTDDELAELEAKRRELGIWRKSMETWHYHQDEFPQATRHVGRQPMVSVGEHASRQTQEKKKETEKRIKKMKKASKRRNRGKK